MASSGLALTQYVYAFIAASALPKPGDAANITVKIVADGTAATPAGTVTEVDAVNAPGLYSVALTGAENTGFGMALAGKSSTIGVAVTPTLWTNEKLPTATPGAAGGVFIAGSNAATTVNITGNLSGSVGSISGVTFPTNFGATLITSGGNVGIDWGQVANKTTANVLSGTSIATSQVVASVTGAVGSVTGAVGSITGITFPTNFALLAIDGSGDVTTTGTSNNAAADALLDRSSAIEVAITPRLALRYIAAANAGVLSGAATTTVTIKGCGVATTRIIGTVDIDGNRPAVVLS